VAGEKPEHINLRGNVMKRLLAAIVAGMFALTSVPAVLAAKHEMKKDEMKKDAKKADAKKADTKKKADAKKKDETKK
jgi:pentapeptide MXKDX repeat protein